jgi:hypothetical protein
MPETPNDQQDRNGASLFRKDKRKEMTTGFSLVVSGMYARVELAVGHASLLGRRGDERSQLWATHLFYAGRRCDEGVVVFVHVELVALLSCDSHVKWLWSTCASAPGLRL